MLDADVARLSPFIRAHIGIDGHYSFHLPDLHGTHRPLRAPDAGDDEWPTSAAAPGPDLDHRRLAASRNATYRATV